MADAGRPAEGGDGPTTESSILLVQFSFVFLIKKKNISRQTSERRRGCPSLSRRGAYENPWRQHTTQDKSVHGATPKRITGGGNPYARSLPAGGVHINPAVSRLGLAIAIATPRRATPRHQRTRAAKSTQRRGAPAHLRLSPSQLAGGRGVVVDTQHATAGSQTTSQSTCHAVPTTHCSPPHAVAVFFQTAVASTAFASIVYMMTAAAAGTFGGVRTHIYMVRRFAFNFHSLLPWLLCGPTLTRPTLSKHASKSNVSTYVCMNLDLLDEIKAAR